MKKFVTMVMVLIMVLMAVAAVAEPTELMPKVHLNDLENTFWNDDCDIHITMYMSMPEYEYVRLEMNVKFNDNDWQNYNNGTATLYDGNTGEFIDQTIGNLTYEVDCSSKDVETVRSNMLNYVQNYDYEADYEEHGIKYFSIWF